MAKITGIRLTHLRNDESYSFHKVASALATEISSDSLKPLTAAYVEAFERLRLAIDQSAGQGMAQVVREADAARDNAWRGCNSYIKAVSLYSPNETERSAAEKIAAVFASYGNPTSLTLSEETSVVDNLIESVEALGTKCISEAKFTAWLSDFKTKEEAYEKASEAHVNDRASKVLGEVKRAREAADKEYSAVTSMVEALSVVYGDEGFLDFVSKLNVIIERQKQVTKFRRTRLAKTSGEKE